MTSSYLDYPRFRTLLYATMAIVPENGLIVTRLNIDFFRRHARYRINHQRDAKFLYDGASQITGSLSSPFTHWSGDWLGTPITVYVALVVLLVVWVLVQHCAVWPPSLCPHGWLLEVTRQVALLGPTVTGTAGR